MVYTCMEGPIDESDLGLSSKIFLVQFAEKAGEGIFGKLKKKSNKVSQIFCHRGNGVEENFNGFRC